MDILPAKQPTPPQEQPQRRPADNRVIEEPNGWYFPGWGIEVAKTAQLVTRKLVLGKLKEQTVTVQVAATAEDAKKLVLEQHGKDVDKDEPPPQELVPERQQPPGASEANF